MVERGRGIEYIDNLPLVTPQVANLHQRYTMPAMDKIPYMPRKSPNPRLRWRSWYVAIADWMLSHPGGKMGDCAKFLGKSPATLSILSLIHISEPTRLLSNSY